MSKINISFLFSLVIIFLLMILFNPIIVKASEVSLDSSFGTTGKEITSSGYQSQVLRIVVLPNGEIILVGITNNGNNSDWIINKYNLDGTNDISFGNNGIITKDFGGNDILDAIQLQTDGKIIVGGVNNSTGSPTYTWTIARFNSNGILDDSFGNNGVTTTFIPSALESIKIQSDNKIIGIGYHNTGTNDDVALARYNPDGMLDTTFGTNGTVVTPIGSSNDRGNAAVLEPDGKIVVTGDFDAGGHDDIFLVRYNTDGSLDSSFGVGGIVRTQIDYYDNSHAIALQPDGKILIAGATKVNTSSNTYVARYNTDGSLDSSFGTNGKAIYSFSDASDGANSMILEPNDKILLGGYADSGTSSGREFALMLFNPNGTIDASFGTNGIYLTPVGTGGSATINDIVQQGNKITAAGYASNGSYDDMALVRYQYDLPPLSVPYFNQKALPWGNTEYDHAKTLGAYDPTMARWGCAVTSVAMVLNYHNIKQFTDGTQIDPGSLNKWLNANNGFDYGYGSDGWYSYLNWAIIGTLTKDLYDAGKAPVKLEYSKLGAKSQQNDTILNNDLTVGNDFGPYPDILWVKNASTSGHFVVATGVDGTTYTINDPYWNVPELTSFNNDYMQVGRYIPSHSNLSYIVLVVNPDVQIMVTDPQNRKTGELIQNEQTQSFNEIPGATYDFAPPISNPDSQGNLHQLGTGVNEFLLPQPADGKYTVTLSSNTNQYYTINLSTFEQDGTNDLNKMLGLTNSSITNSFTIDFSQTDHSSVQKSITFDSTIQDIRESQKLGLINRIFGDKLIIDLKVAQRQYGKHHAVATKLLELDIKLLNANNKHHTRILSQTAYTILQKDFTTLVKLTK